MPTGDRDLPKGGKRLKNLIEGRGNGNGKVVNIRELTNGEELLTILANTLDEDGGITFSRTSDGGAVCITFYLGKSKAKGYAASRDKWLEEMGDLVE